MGADRIISRELPSTSTDRYSVPSEVHCWRKVSLDMGWWEQRQSCLLVSMAWWLLDHHLPARWAWVQIVVNQNLSLPNILLNITNKM